MATVNFLYRSTRKKAPLNVRLLFSHHNKNYVIGGKTQMTVSKEYWDNDHDKQRINDIDRSNFQKDVKQHLHKLETYILKAFHNTDVNDVSKEWLKKQIQLYYNPENEKKQAPDGLIDFFDFYIDIKRNDLSATRIQRLHVIKRKIERFEKYTGKTITIPKVNDTFKKNFLEFGKTNHYSPNTLKSDFSVIKTVCNYSTQWSIKTSPQLKNLKSKAQSIKAPYLTPAEIEVISNLDLSNNERLDNVRDWLLISCYTGQRVSDFMRFKSEMIKKKENKYLLEFKQKRLESV